MASQFQLGSRSHVAANRGPSGSAANSDSSHRGQGVFMLPSSRFTLLVAAAVVGLAGVSAARAGIIYQDTFNRTGSLNGSSPTIANTIDGGSSSATWTAPGWNTNGTQVVLGSGTSNVQGAASLPFTPQTGLIYTLSETVVWQNVPSTIQNGAWIALGFSGGNGYTGNQYNSLVNPSAWMLMRGYPTSSNQNSTFYGGGTSNVQAIGTDGGTTNIALVLNTQSSLWTLDWYVNGTSVRTATFTMNPTITTVSFGNNSYVNGNSNTLSAIQNFELSVPEPATLGLMSAGGIGILLVGRKRKQP